METLSKRKKAAFNALQKICRMNSTNHLDFGKLILSSLYAQIMMIALFYKIVMRKTMKIVHLRFEFSLKTKSTIGK